MRFATFCSAATALIAATPGVVYAAESGYEGGKPFILKSNPRQQKDTADFENKYVAYNYVPSGPSYLSLGDKSKASVFAIVNDTVVVQYLSPPVSISLYPYDVKVQNYDNGTSVATAPNGFVLAPSGPGDFWKVFSSTSPGTTHADPTKQYGLLYNEIRFCGWGACKNPVKGDPNRIDVFWQRCPSRITGPPGCTTMFVLAEDPNSCS